MVRATVCAALLAALGVSVRAQAQPPPDIYPLAKVRTGQKGFGLTVIQGTEPTRFDFEVIGIAKNFVPKIDIILVKSDDPKLALTGFARGMSGSPLFLDGKVACALSYVFRFSKTT